MTFQIKNRTRSVGTVAMTNYFYYKKALCLYFNFG